MNAIGIDVSKDKSTVTIQGPGDVVLMPLRYSPQSAINVLIDQIKNLDVESKVFRTYRRYYESVATWLADADIFARVVNPILIKYFVDDSLRSSKTDKTDSKKSPVILLTAGQN